ncbi:MAG: sulfatase-like hydrolase/transferase [Leptospirales bacterium]|nr:sulfatase-like hydrolase/transferase [Leptospirales bacterium]
MPLPSPRWFREFAAHAAARYSLGLAAAPAALAALAWALESLLFAIRPGDQAWPGRLGRSLIESVYLLAPLLSMAGIYLSGVAASTLSFHSRRLAWLRAAPPLIGSLAIFWSFIRVTVYYYMNLKIDAGLAFYALLELRQLIASETAIAVSSVPLHLPLLYLLLMTGCAGWPWIYGRWRRTRFGQAQESRGGRMLALAATLMLICGAAAPALALGASRAAQAAQAGELLGGRARIRMITLNRPEDFPAFELKPPLHRPQRFAAARFGLQLPEGTNVVFIVLESARDSFVEFDRTQHFRSDADTLSVDRFFVPVPHSSNSHYSLFTGMHSGRDFLEKYRSLRPEPTLVAQLMQRGYRSYYIYTDHTSFENETVFLQRLNFQITEKRDFLNRINPQTGRAYISFPFGLDDMALLHGAMEALDRDQGPFVMSLVMTNSHYPYFNPDPQHFQRFDDATSLGRHRNGVDYALHVADRVYEEFQKRGLDKNTLFVLFSDHGESFGEHGFYRHSFSVFNEEVRAPIIFKHPALARLPMHRLERGTILDVYPTVFDLLGLDWPESLHGRSLLDPAYEFFLPLWVWRLDDYRGLIYQDVKWVYNALEDTLVSYDLDDQKLQAWEMDEYARRFVSALRDLDYGKAVGVHAAAGSRRAPAAPESPTIGGGGFVSGGGRFRRGE